MRSRNEYLLLAMTSYSSGCAVPHLHCGISPTVRKLFCLLLIFMFLFCIVSPVFAETVRGNGCRLSAWWDDKERCIRVVAECSLIIEGSDKISRDTRSVSVKVEAIPLAGNKGVTESVKVPLKDGSLDNKTFLHSYGTFSPRGVKPGDRFKFAAKFTDERGNTFAALSVDNVRWDAGKTPDEPEGPKSNLEVKYADSDKYNRDGYVLISATNAHAPIERTKTKIFWSVGGGVRREIDLRGWGNSFDRYKFIPPDPKEGQTYKFILEIHDKDGKVIETDTKSITWGNPRPGDEEKPGESDGPADGSGPGGEQIQDKGGTFEKIIAGIVDVPCTVIENLCIKYGKCKSLDELVFMQGLSEEQKKNLPWEGREPEHVRLWFNVLMIVTAPFFVFAIVATAFKLMYAVAKPDARAEAVESIQRWFLAVAIVALAPILVSTLMWISGLAVDAIAGAFQEVSSTVGMGRAVGDWGQVSVAGVGIVTGSVLGTAVVRLFLALMFGYLNCLYIIRKLALTVFFCFTPIMALLWAINKNTTAATIWLGELASNAFMPVAHALVLSTILLICDVKNMGNGSWLTIVVMLYALIPTAEAVRNSLQSIFARWAGLNEESTAAKAFGAAMGLGGIMSIARVGYATLGGTKITSASKGDRGAAFPLTGMGPKPVRQIGFRVGQQDSIGQFSAKDTMPVGSALSPGGTAPRIGSIPPGEHPSYTRGYASLSSGPGNASSPRYERAVRFGAVAGKVAALGATALVGMVGGAVPGGREFVKPIASAVGAGTRMAATGAHLAGGYIYRKAGERISTAALKGSGPAQKVLDTSQRIKSAFQRPGVQKVVEAGKAASIVIRSGADPHGALQRAKYMDTGSSLDGPRER